MTLLTIPAFGEIISKMGFPDMFPSVAGWTPAEADAPGGRIAALAL
jgi:hypothetical protein